ncbi:MAG: ABC transporter permease [Eggerthellaceae bacterium]|nr:ABC transporter permease [Eggerthellaceae bacterium]
MARVLSKRFFIAQMLLLVLVAIIVGMPNAKILNVTYFPLLVALAIMDALYFALLVAKARRGIESTGPNDIILFVWVLIIIWELASTKLAVTPNVIVPTPEEVFNVFATSYGTLWANVVSSTSLLMIGFLGGIFFGVVLGIICGWVPRLREMFYPIANVMAPIPPTVFAPYLVVLMPSFRSASACIILLGVFWPQFLNMVLRVSSLDPQLMDNARALCVKNWTMITKIILPYVMPGVLQGLRVSLTTAFLMLTFAEMIGATAGIGFYITNSNIYANYAAVIAGIIVCGIVVTVLSAITSWVQRRFTVWR